MARTSRRASSPMSSVLALALLLTVVSAHEHHNDEALSDENLAKPIDTIMWLHILVQVITWGFMFPIGMVLGLSRSRFHVPLQVTAFALTIGGYFLGHKHGGRAFPSTVHGVFANILMLFILIQLSLGIYLKLHIHEKTIRPYVVPFHGVIGKMWPVLGWCQMLFGAFTLRGYCLGGATGQCLAHYIMGSAFIGYGVLLALAMSVGAAWLRRRGQSQEWFDSWVIFLWGIVNTFTEHRGSLTKWSHKDLQHTMLGVLWWTGGALGIFLSRNGRRSVVPAIIILLTGWAMSSHEQAMMISTKVHAMFGVVLGSAGLARIIEICFVLKDAPTPSTYDPDAEDVIDAQAQAGQMTVSSFQHLPPFLLVAGGILFMSATDEELKFVMSLEIDHVTYILIMISLAFIIYLYALFLINLYLTSGLNASQRLTATGSKPLVNGQYQPIRLPRSSAAGRFPLNHRDTIELDAGTHENGSAEYSGVLRNHDAEVFELGEYEDEEDERGGRRV